MKDLTEMISKRAQQATAEKVFPGCVIGVVRAKGEREVWPSGSLTYGGEPVREDTIYDLASITKSIPTASLALKFLVEKSTRLNLVDKVSKYLPELQHDFGATVEDLLRYRVKGPQMSTLRFKTFEETRTRIFETGFDGPPGEAYYTNLPAFLLGLIVEHVGDAILPALAHRSFFEPLQMSDTTFFPHDISRIAPTEVIDGGEIRGIVHDESARVFARARRAVGHAGLFSTAPDLLKFLEALLTNVGHRMSHIGDGAQQGLGWSIDEPWRRGRYGKKMFSKTGFTGTLVACDVEQGIGLVILSNRTYPHRPPDNSAINSFRADIADIILS